MKRAKVLASIVGVLVFFVVASSIQAQEKEISSDKLELQLLWSKEYEWPLAEQVGTHISDDGETIAILTQKGFGAGRWKTRIEMCDKAGKTLWGKVIDEKVMYSQLSGNGQYLLTYVGGEDTRHYVYYQRGGKVLWDKRIGMVPIRLSPDGEYLGYSGALSTSSTTLSNMDWWELRDKNFNLIWKYQPKWKFNAAVLPGGKTLMVEGNNIKLYDKAGRISKQVLIPEIKPYKFLYQFGSVLPMESDGPYHLEAADDGQYAAFVYPRRKDKSDDKEWVLYSVDMETGKWWSYLVEGGSDISWTNATGLTGDGKYLLLYLEKGLFSFDNANGKLLWKDTTGWDVWDGSLLSRPEDVSELLGLMVVSWGGGLKWSDRTRYEKEGIYIVDFNGKRLWQRGGGSFSYHERFSKDSRILLTEKEGKVSLYEVNKK